MASTRTVSGPETVRAPLGWEVRLIRVDVQPRPASKRRPAALCLEPHDLVLAKCARGSERDWDFAREAIVARLVDPETLLARADDLPLDASDRSAIRTMLSGLIARAARPAAR
jgi:hypothetical protein